MLSVVDFLSKSDVEQLVNIVVSCITRGISNLDSKTRNKIVILGTVFGSVLLSYSATVFFIPNAYAINNTKATDSGD